MALTGLVLAMLAAASPAAAGDPVPPADRPVPRLFLGDDGGFGARARAEVWPIAIDLDLGDREHGLGLPPLGLAVRLSADASLGAAGGVDLGGDEMVGIIALDLAF